jgi:hypothetical protein
MIGVCLTLLFSIISKLFCVNNNSINKYSIFSSLLNDDAQLFYVNPDSPGDNLECSEINQCFFLSILIIFYLSNFDYFLML